MADFLLRIEVVNLSNIIDDTDDLSTRRGGSLLALHAVEEAWKWLKEFRFPSNYESNERSLQFSVVSTNASTGTFVINAIDMAGATQVKEFVDRRLKDETLSSNPEALHLSHATIVSDIIPIENGTAGFSSALHRGTAANRWRQLREPSLSVDNLWNRLPNASNEFCALDRVRPGVHSGKLPEDKDRSSDKRKSIISESVYRRREYGRDAKRGFYAKESGIMEFKAKFVNDLPELAEPRDSAAAISPTRLTGKIAVFYVDGNRFGKIAEEAAEKGEDEYSKLSAAIRDHHRGLLKSLLKLTEEEEGWKTNKGDIRLETLLWGGDEIMWVVPAWKGWRLAEWFFSQCHEITNQTGPQLLTYSAGLVFCRDNAPIKNVTQLAKRLAERVKDSQSLQGRSGVAYEVLESYDDITSDLETHRDQWLPNRKADDPYHKEFHRDDRLVIEGSRLGGLIDATRRIAQLDDFPRRRLYQLCRAWREEQDDFDSLKEFKGSLRDDKDRDAIYAVESLSPGSAVGWLHLLQILPYITPVVSAQPNSAESTT